MARRRSRYAFVLPVTWLDFNQWVFSISEWWWDNNDNFAWLWPHGYEFDFGYGSTELKWTVGLGGGMRSTECRSSFALGRYYISKTELCVIGYSKENLKIHTGVPSHPFLPSLTLPPPLFPFPCLPSLSPFPSLPISLPLEVEPLQSS